MLSLHCVGSYWAFNYEAKDPQAPGVAVGVEAEKMGARVVRAAVVAIDHGGQCRVLMETVCSSISPGTGALLSPSQSVACMRCIVEPCCDGGSFDSFSETRVMHVLV